ncbi:MAG: hypothetical protein VCD00_15300 [Candidatus Hydrogenedentota bacterium]
MIAIFLVVSFPFCSDASETDQFMVWGVELEDSAPALNGWLNEQLDEYVVELNEDEKWLEASIDEVTVGYYRHIFKHLLNQKARQFLREGEGIDEYPPRDEMSVWQYQEASVFRGRSFPYYLPMARTIRMGEVYLGTDKIGHFLGYGRRYFEKYVRHRERGMSDREAQEKTIRWGMLWELSVVGRMVDGIVSYADLEANYQGMRMAIDMSSESDPMFVFEDGRWSTMRAIDLLPYMTPDLDESYNTNHYWLLRKRYVLPILREEIVGRLYDADVQARFKVYDAWEPSLNMQYIERYLAGKKRDPRALQSLETLYEQEYGAERSAASEAE